MVFLTEHLISSLVDHLIDQLIITLLILKINYNLKIFYLGVSTIENTLDETTSRVSSLGLGMYI